MPKTQFKTLTSKEKDEKLEVSRQMFFDNVGRRVKFGLVGQIVFWDNENNFGYIRAHTSGERYKCNGSAFLNECNVKDMVKFDVWQNNETNSQKAVNVSFLKGATSVTKDKIGTIVRCVHLAGAEGKVVKLNNNYGFVSTKLLHQDIYINGTEVARAHAQKIRCHIDRITFDVIMEKNGSLTAENIKVRQDLVKSHELAANARQLAADFSSGRPVPVKKVKIVEHDAEEKLCEAEKRASEYRKKRDAEARAKAKSTLAETKDDASTAASEAVEDDRTAPAPAVDNDWKAPAPGVDDDWEADWKAPVVEAADDDSAAQKVAAVDDSVKEVHAVDDDCASTAASDLPSSTPAFQHWTKEDVSKWLQGVGLNSYVPIFQDNCVDGEILSDMRGAGTDEMKRMLQGDLKVKSIHLKRFERCLNDLA